MNDKKIKEAMKQYIETQADNISSESEEKHDLTSLDEKALRTKSWTGNCQISPNLRLYSIGLKP